MTAWTDHVRDKAKEYGLSYKAAMIDDRVKGSYTKAPRKKATKPQAPSDPPKTAKERRTMAASRAMELIHKRTAAGKQSWHDAVSQVIQESADAGARFMKEKKPRKPMSEETKAMLKARREAKKADVAKKFEAFWERHEGIPAGQPSAGRTPSLATIAKAAAEAAVEKTLKSVVPAESEVVVVAPKKKRVRKPKVETSEQYFAYGERPEPSGNQNHMLKRYHASNRARVITLAQRGTQYQKELAQEILYGRIL